MHGLIFMTSISYRQDQPGIYCSFLAIRSSAKLASELDLRIASTNPKSFFLRFTPYIWHPLVLTHNRWGRVATGSKNSILHSSRLDCFASNLVQDFAQQSPLAIYLRLSLTLGLHWYQNQTKSRSIQIKWVSANWFTAWLYCFELLTRFAKQQVV